MEGHIKANQTIGKIGQEVLCILVCLLIIVPIKTMGQGRGISALMDILFPKMEVQAGTIDANGHTVATDLSGTAGALLTDDNILYIFRTTDSLSMNSTYTYTKDGKSYKGIIKTFDFENNTSINATAINDASLVTKIVFLDDIRPKGGGIHFNNCTSVTEIEGMKEHFDTSEMTWIGSMFDDCSNLTSLDVSGFDTSNATGMSYMFLGCSSLTSITGLSGFNTSKVKSMDGMFNGCSSLTSIDVSSFDTSNVTDMTRMFRDCASLQSLNLSNFDTKNVTNMGDSEYGGMFFGCSKLKELTLSDKFNTEQVTNMSKMFSDCSSLTSLDVSGFNTSNVADMRYMFKNCSGLTSLDGISNWDTSKVTNMGSMFRNCSKLTSLDGISNWNTSNVTNMNSMFESCSGLTSLDVSNFDTSNVTGMGFMFNGCSKLISLDVSGFNTSKVTSMYQMFDGCSGLTSLDVSKFDTSNVMTMESMFAGCSKLTSLDVSGFNTSEVTSMYQMFDGCRNLTFLDVSKFNTSNVTTMGSMFENCLGLTSLDGIFSWNPSKVTNTSRMFYNCKGLTSLDVSGFDISNVTDMNYMFALCSSLASLDVSEFNTSKVTDMGGMFANCSSLISLDVSGFDTRKVTDMGYMFASCSSLVSLDVSGFDTKNVTSMRQMFSDCSSLTSLDVSSFDTSNVGYMDGMFADCSKLTSLDVSDFDTSKVKYMYNMFWGCSGLTSLDVSGFDTSNGSDTSRMFYNCSSLTSLDISGFDTSNVTNMYQMFIGCSELTSIFLGSKTKLQENCSLPTQPDRSKFTGKWVLNDPYNHTDQCSAEGLVAKTQSSGGAPGLWVAERTGADPKTQGYTSISANIYDAASHMNADGSIKTGEDPVSLYRTDAGGSGYWQKLADGRWAYTFFVFKNDETDWQVWEDGVSGYTGDYTIKTPLSISGTDIQKGDQPVITNTKNDAPKYGSLKLTKKVAKADGFAVATTQEFTFNITLTGNSISGSQIFGDTPFSNGSATVHLANGESISFTEIPAGTTYKIEETPVSGFTGSLDHPSGTLTANGIVSVLCTNTKQEKQKDYVSMSVKKTVTSNADESDTEFPFHAAFTNLEANVTYQTSNGTSFTADVDGNANADFTLKQNQTITFQNIPVGGKYTITEDGGDYLSSYKITDSAGVNKIVSSTGKSVQTDTNLSTAQESADKGENVLVTFQNNITRTQNLIVTKKSVKADGSVNEDDSNQYLIDIILTGLSGGQKIKTSNGVLIADDDGIIENSMYITPSQRLILFNVPVGVKYKFTEEANDKTASYKLTNAAKALDLSEYSTPSEISDEIATFLDGHTENWTTPYDVVKHAHTANVDDDGNQSGSYTNNVNYQSSSKAMVDGQEVSENLQTVTIPGASSLKVDVTYQTESTSWDWLYIYQGTITGSDAADKGTGGTLLRSGKIGGSTKTKLNTITTPGDTVSFVWRTDGSGNNYYGYYAVITGTLEEPHSMTISKADTGVNITEDGTTTKFNFMKASSEIKNHKAQLRLDFYSDPNGDAETTVYLDTGITESEYNKMDAATRDHDVLNALSLSGNPTIVSSTGANTAANTSLATAEETVDAGENITVAFTNTAPKAAKLKVTKYDNTANKHKLGGAEFALYTADGTPVNFTADGSNVITIGTNGESDVLNSPLFVEGSYYLVETKAPAGYTVNGEPKAFQITAADAGKTLQIEVYDDKLIVFPVTGGEGNRYILSIACIFGAAAVAMIIYRKRREAA